MTLPGALDAIVGRRRQIIDMITAENNRLGFALPAVQKGIKKHIRWLERQLSDIDSELRRFNPQEPRLAGQEQPPARRTRRRSEPRPYPHR